MVKEQIVNLHVSEWTQTKWSLAITSPGPQSLLQWSCRDGHCPLKQYPFPPLHGRPFWVKVFAGQAAERPVQYSARSQSPDFARQMLPVGFSWSVVRNRWWCTNNWNTSTHTKPARQNSHSVTALTYLVPVWLFSQWVADTVSSTYLAVVAALSFCTLSSHIQLASGGIATGILTFLWNSTSQITFLCFACCKCIPVFECGVHQPPQSHSHILLRALRRHFHTLAPHRCAQWKEYPADRQGWSPPRTCWAAADCSCWSALGTRSCRRTQQNKEMRKKTLSRVKI